MLLFKQSLSCPCISWRPKSPGTPVGTRAGGRGALKLAQQPCPLVWRGGSVAFFMAVAAEAQLEQKEAGFLMEVLQEEVLQEEVLQEEGLALELQEREGMRRHEMRRREMRRRKTKPSTYQQGKWEQPEQERARRRGS